MATFTWTASTSGLWTTASNWSPAAVPSTGDTVLVNQSGAYQVTMPGSVSVALASLTMGDALGELVLGGSVQANSLTVSAGTLDVTGQLNVTGSATLGGTIVGWTNPPSGAVLNGVAWWGPLDLNGTLTITNGITLTGSNGSGPGTITTPNAVAGLENPLTLNFINTTFNNATFSGLGNIDAETMLTIGSGATFSQTPAFGPAGGPTLEFTGSTILNQGTILAQSVDTPFGYNPNTTLNIAPVEFTNSGLISGIDSSSPVPPSGLGFPSAFTGAMTIDITGTFDNLANGVIETGQSAGVALLSVAASATLTNNGTILTQAPSSTAGGTVDIATFLGGNGTVDINGGGLVTLESSAAATQSLDFTGGGALVFDQPANMPATINGFGLNDSIQLNGVSATGVSYTNGDLRLQVIGSQSTFDLAITGAHSLSNFVISAVGTNTIITLACFAAGTRLATARGLVAVEELYIGDAMLLADEGGSLPVKWIGHREIDCSRHPAPHKIWPVCIAAGAFADGVPRCDLYLSPDHAVCVNGVLIPVKHLVNDTTVAQVEMRRVSYWHVELPRHAVLLAEGLSVESLLPGSDRSGFANGGGVLALHPAWAWEARGCAPLTITGPEVVAARTALARRADLIYRNSKRSAQFPARLISAGNHSNAAQSQPWPPGGLAGADKPRTSAGFAAPVAGGPGPGPFHT